MTVGHGEGDWLPECRDGVVRLAAAAIVATLLAAGCAALPDGGGPSEASEVVTPSAPAAETSCSPTAPNGVKPPGEEPSREFFGNGKLFTLLWPNGVVIFEPGGPGEIRDDGSLAMKWPFWRGAGVSGELTIEGRSLHRPGLSVSAEIPDEYGKTGVQPTALVFPEPGCWEVTARAGGTSLTFVTKVELRR
jgi:hypothetical protein